MQETRQSFIDLRGLGPDYGRMVARQYAIDMDHDLVPVTQQIKGDDRRNDDQAENIKNGDAAGKYLLQKTANNAQRLATQVADGILYLGNGMRIDARQVSFSPGHDRCAYVLHITGNGGDKRIDLRLDHRQQ